MNSKVFISSTVYDLIDIRGELYLMLNDMGLDPIMSDIAESNFEVHSDKNSIETCLLNLDKCEHAIFVFSQRYGPSLKSVGFDDYSATHLEYLRAKKSKKNIYVYVRDRLEADYAIWKKNKGNKNISLSWVDQRNTRIFKILKDHSTLSKSKPQSNWYKTFKDSVELKVIIRNDFNIKAAEVNISRLFAKNEFPLLHPKLNVTLTKERPFPKMIFTVTLKNVSNSPAFNLYTEWLDEDKKNIKDPNQDKNIIAPTQEYSLSFLYVVRSEHFGTKVDLKVRYSNIDGYEVTEVYKVSGYIQQAIQHAILSGCTLKERTFSVGKAFKVNVN